MPYTRLRARIGRTERRKPFADFVLWQRSGNDIDASFSPITKDPFMSVTEFELSVCSSLRPPSSNRRRIMDIRAESVLAHSGIQQRGGLAKRSRWGRQVSGRGTVEYEITRTSRVLGVAYTYDLAMDRSRIEQLMASFVSLPAGDIEADIAVSYVMRSC